MCLGVPGQVVELSNAAAGGLATARVAFGGVTRSVCVALVPEAGPGDYVLVHAGIALQKIDEEHASELLEHLRAMSPDELADVEESS